MALQGPPSPWPKALAGALLVGEVFYVAANPDVIPEYQQTAEAVARIVVGSTVREAFDRYELAGQAATLSEATTGVLRQQLRFVSYATTGVG